MIDKPFYHHHHHHYHHHHYDDHYYYYYDHHHHHYYYHHHRRSFGEEGKNPPFLPRKWARHVCGLMALAEEGLAVRTTVLTEVRSSGAQIVQALGIAQSTYWIVVTDAILKLKTEPSTITARTVLTKSFKLSTLISSAGYLVEVCIIMHKCIYIYSYKDT
jgi:hypothetical protein